MLAHTEIVDPAVESTCAEPGLTKGSHCSVCGEIIVAQKPVAKIAHTYVNDPAVAATCEQNGWTAGFHCGACGEVFIERTMIPALGHEWDEPAYT